MTEKNSAGFARTLGSIQSDVVPAQAETGYAPAHKKRTGSVDRMTRLRGYDAAMIQHR